MASIGIIQSLTVLRLSTVGAYLDGGSLGEILLPNRYVTKSVRPETSIEVFIHRDSSDRLVATTDSPKIQAGQCAFLQVAQVNETGAFVDIGLDKQLLVPFAEQHKPMEVGRSYLIYCFLNSHDARLVGTSKIDRWLPDTAPQEWREGQQVNLIVGPTTDLGVKVIVERVCWGLIHKSHIVNPLRFGQSLKGFIESIRSDQKLNIGLKNQSTAQSDDAQMILTYLRLHGGEADVGDKSAPEVIAREFGLSKASFKRAIGALYRQKCIDLGPEHIRIIE